MPKVMRLPRRGYRKSGNYRDAHVYIRRDLYLALVLKAINEGRDISEIINQALQTYLNPNSPAPQQAVNPAPREPSAPSTRGTETSEDAFTDNPWVNIIKRKQA